MPPAGRRLISGAAPAAAASALSLLLPVLFLGLSVLAQETIDVRTIPSAPEYLTETPKGPGFLGGGSMILGLALDRVNKALGASLLPDNRLARLARWIYGRLGTDRSLPPQSALDLVAGRLGLIEPLPNVLFVQAPDATRLAETVTARLRGVFDLADDTHIGGVAEYEENSSVVAVIVLSGRHIEMAPVPRSLAAAGPILLDGRLTGPYVKPELAHTLPSGETRLSSLGPGRDFRKTVDLVETGRHRLEILAEGPAGPVVIANFPVYVAVPVEEAVESAAAPRRPAGAAEARDRLFELINADRAKAGARALAFDAPLAEVALRHSRDMRANGFVAHISPTTGSADDRLRAAGIVTSLVLECVGKGYSPDEIHQGFMDSPAHRAAILSPDATHVGIGVVAAKEEDRTTYFVTELFIRRIPKLGSDAKAVFLADLDGRRARSGASQLEEDEGLSRLADEAARDFMENRALTEDQVLARLKERLVRLKPGSPSITAVLSVVDSLATGAERAAADPRAAGAAKFGVGIAQGARPGLPPNSIVLVLIYAE